MTPQELKVVLERMGVRKLRIGHGNIHGCCPSPSHQENRPSWGISTTEPHLHGCFSCGFKGALVDLLVDVGHYGYNEAARLCNIQKPGEYKLPALALKSSGGYGRLDPSGLFPFEFDAPAARYVRRRGIAPDLAEQLGLLRDHNLNRLLFPWRWNGNLVGVTGRALGEHPVKTLPYFDTPKGDWLYCPSGKLQERQSLILVEGEFDALKCHAAGFPNVAALSFAVFTDRQQTLVLNSAPKEVILAFDGDRAGQEVMFKVAKSLQDFVPLRAVDWDQVRPLYGDEPDPADLSCLHLRRLLKDARSLMVRAVRSRSK